MTEETTVDTEEVAARKRNMMTFQQKKAIEKFITENSTSTGEGEDKRIRYHVNPATGLPWTDRSIAAHFMTDPLRTELKIDVCTQHNIAGVREEAELGKLKSRGVPKPKTSREDLIDRVATLEQDLASLTELVKEQGRRLSMLRNSSEGPATSVRALGVNGAGAQRNA
jgi:hypothetical protein